MSFANLLGLWVAATLTIAILSFLYRDNPLYKFAEHVYVGVSAAYFIIYSAKFTMELQLINEFKSNLEAYLQQGSTSGLVEALLLIIPTILGILMLTRWVGPKIGWISRWPIAFTIGLGAGLGITGGIQGVLLPQVQATIEPLWVSPFSGANLWAAVGSLLMILGVVSTLIYFYFSRPHRGFIGVVSRIGIIFIMVSFGAAFGATVMARVSLLIGRLYFLVNEWIGGTIDFIQAL
ncbi:hypothetical protein GF359_07620 [candidate division WOR-3 bacterium]|uniref:Uncharacterized protein n=1 Tax=candidate division WOR-3 bacterium TaxID=2052148 RepID=A0A9D5QCY8_UNCW3|nr:hypothetical protein [candidate division WOR-3 bacterium]MBD3365069.1 hypothetical protein [candidate division WOR-3 bacterium]